MSDGSLSQDEVDALLQDAGAMDFGEPAPARQEGLSDQQLSELGNTVNGVIGTMGSNLSMLLTKSVTLGTPQIDQVNGEMVATSLGDAVVSVTMDFSDGASGDHGFILNEDVALQIAGPMQGMDGVELDDASLNALQEAFQNINGPLITALSDSSGTSVMTEAPVGKIGSKSDVGLSGKFVRLSYPLSIDGQELGIIVEYFAAQAISSIIPARASGSGVQSQSGGMDLGGIMGGQQPQMGGMMGGPQPQTGGMMGGQQPQMGGMMGGQQPQMGGMMGGQQPQMGGMMGGPQPQMSGMVGEPAVQGVQFPSFGVSGASGAEHGNIGLLMDVYMEMTVELGRTRKLIKDILGMGEGTIIELDKLAGEPVDILVNHKLIAKGEVVVIDENFGVRVTEIVSPMERMNTIS